MKIKVAQRQLSSGWATGYFYKHTLGDYAQEAKDALDTKIQELKQKLPPEPIEPPIPEGYPPLKEPVKPTPPNTYTEYRALPTTYADEAMSETEYNYDERYDQYEEELKQYKSDLKTFNSYQKSDLAKQHMKYEMALEQYKKDYTEFQEQTFTIKQKQALLASLNEPISYQQVILAPNDIEQTTGKLTTQAQEALATLRLSQDAVNALDELNKASMLVHQLKKECLDNLQNPFFTDGEKLNFKSIYHHLNNENSRCMNEPICTMLEYLGPSMISKPQQEVTWSDAFSIWWDTVGLRIAAFFDKNTALIIEQQQKTVDLARNEGFFGFKNRQGKITQLANQVQAPEQVQEQAPATAPVTSFPDFKKQAQQIASTPAENFFIQQLNDPKPSITHIYDSNGKQHNLAELASNHEIFDKKGGLLKKLDENHPLKSQLSFVQELLKCSFGNALDKHNLTDLEKFKVHALITATDATVAAQFPLTGKEKTEKTLSQQQRYSNPNQELSTHSAAVKDYLQENASTIVEKVRSPALDNTHQATMRP